MISQGKRSILFLWSEKIQSKGADLFLKLKGRLVASISVLIANLILVYFSYELHGDLENHNAILLPIFLVIGWICGKQYDKKQLLTHQLKVKTKELEDQRDKYQSFFLYHPDSVCEVSEDGLFIAGNKAMEELLGAPTEHIKNKGFSSFIFPDDFDKVKDNLQLSLSGTAQHYEARIIKASGDLINIEATNLPIYIGGEPKGTFVIAKDITDKKRALQKVEQLQTLLQNTISEQQGMIFKFVKNDGKFIHTLCDGSLTYKIGLTPSIVTGNTLENLLDKEDAKRKLACYERAWSGEEVTYEGNGVGIGKNTSYLATLRPIFQNGEVESVIGSAVDITDRKQIERALRESEERYRIIAEHSSDMIRILDPNFHFTYLSPSNERVLGYPSNELIGKKAIDFIHSDDIQKARSALEQILTYQKPVSEIVRYRTADKQWKWVESTMSPVFEDNTVTSIVAVSRDITERKKMEEQLRFMAYHDTLTGLPNRRMFENALKQEIITAKELNQSFAVLYFDIDRFKVINDTLGHKTGDLLLNAVTKRIQSYLRKEDLFARMGGDEFVLLIRNITSAEGAEEIAKRILHSFRTVFSLEGNDIFVTSSIGISLFPTHCNDPEELVKQADMAMYHSKEKGKNTYHFYATKNQADEHRTLLLERDLRKSLLQHEFFLMYQPKVSFTTNQITSCEAQLRWKHPTLGLISPNEFIPIAEESGMIVPIGEWVIREACKQHNLWKAKGFPPIRIAINLSLKQILNKDLFRNICTIMQEFQIDPHYLEFEITESTMMKDLSSALQLLNELRGKGISISIDDFGTGYSSLSHLKEFPLDILKIDRSFIQDIPEDEEDKAITGSIISMSKHLKLITVAEGVETKEQYEFLRDVGCDEYQGFYFSRPLLGEDMELFLHLI